MKKLAAIILLSVLITGCAGHKMQLTCRHQSVACALVAAEQYGRENVGIAIGVASGIKARHAQAYINNGNKIVWLSKTTYGCEITERDWFDPTEYVGINEFINGNYWEVANK
jgi:hypothetical protein